MGKKEIFPLLRQISFDLKQGIGMKKKNFLVPVLLLVIMCTGYYLTLLRGSREPGAKIGPAVLDYLFYAFEGMPLFRKELREAFFIPAGWVVFYFWLVYINGKYPKTYLSGIGTQVLLRSGNIQYWWLSKCIWTVAHTCLYYAAAYVTIAAFAILTGSWKLGLTPEYHTKVLPASLEAVSIQRFLLIAVVLPILVSIALCLLQTILSLLTNTVIGILGLVAILIASAYVCTWYWVGNYLMVLRNDSFEPKGVPLGTGCLIAGALSVVCILTGGLILRKKDFIYRKGEL